MKNFLGVIGKVYIAYFLWNLHVLCLSLYIYILFFFSVLPKSTHLSSPCVAICLNKLNMKVNPTDYFFKPITIFNKLIIFHNCVTLNLAREAVVLKAEVEDYDIFLSGKHSTTIINVVYCL